MVDSLLLLQSVESPTFSRTKSGDFEIRQLVAVHHLSPLALEGTLKDLLQMSRILIKTQYYMRCLKENLSSIGTVFETLIYELD